MKIPYEEICDVIQKRRRGEVKKKKKEERKFPLLSTNPSVIWMRVTTYANHQRRIMDPEPILYLDINGNHQGYH